MKAHRLSVFTTLIISGLLLLLPLVFSVRTAGGAWEAVSRAEWLTITANHSGIGTGTVSYAVAANTIGLARKGKLIVGEQVFAVKQKAN